MIVDIACKIAINWCLAKPVVIIQLQASILGNLAERIYFDLSASFPDSQLRYPSGGDLISSLPSPERSPRWPSFIVIATVPQAMATVLRTDIRLLHP